MQMIRFTTTGIDNPEMGLIHVEMAPHQCQHTTENHGFEFCAIGINQDTTGQLLFILGLINAAYDTGGPILQRLCDREIDGRASND